MRNACRGENYEPQISQITQIFKGDTLFCSSLPALGIGAASFASRGQGAGNGEQGAVGILGAWRASKDIAESPTAEPERPETIHNS